MDFFNSLLDKTNKNIEVIAHQLSEIQQTQLKQQEILALGEQVVIKQATGASQQVSTQIPWQDINELQDVMLVTNSQENQKSLLSPTSSSQHKQSHNTGNSTKTKGQSLITQNHNKWLQNNPYA